MDTLRKTSSNGPGKSDENFAMKCEVLLLGMEQQKETAREMARLARQMCEQALQMKKLPRSTALP